MPLKDQDCLLHFFDQSLLVNKSPWGEKKYRGAHLMAFDLKTERFKNVTKYLPGEVIFTGNDTRPIARVQLYCATIQ